MLQITADLFSGRENPVWSIPDDQEVRATLREIARNRALFADGASSDAGLGFRGFSIDVLNDELAMDLGTSSTYLRADAAAGPARELANRLIAATEKVEVRQTVDGMPAFGGQELKSFISRQLDREKGISIPDASTTTAPEDVERAAAITCTIELAPYNPGFWNNNPAVMRNNNCYNYASNKRTDTFAQPGRGCGHMYTAINCGAVGAAALCDGLHHRFDCFPDSEKPRYLVALVIAPGPGFIDFHWYRKLKEGFWGHKPGVTAVRNVDNSGHVIYDPSRCDRGPYTIFCGYFYTCRTQRIR